MTPDLLAKKIESLSRNCLHLRQALSGFEVVLDRENDAIRRSDINELEAITQEKIAFGMAVEDKSLKIRQSIDEFVTIFSLGDTANQPLQLDELLGHVQQEMTQNVEFAVSQTVIDQLEVNIKKLVHERQNIFPKVESNAYMVRKLLQYHRETYAFWQAVASESEAVYGKTGRALTKAKKSILTVRT